jgi:hypothetical protein
MKNRKVEEKALKVKEVREAKVRTSKPRSARPSASRRLENLEADQRLARRLEKIEKYREVQIWQKAFAKVDREEFLHLYTDKRGYPIYQIDYKLIPIGIIIVLLIIVSITSIIF